VAIQHSFNDSSISQNSNPNPAMVEIGAFRVSFPTQVFLTEICQVGVGSRTSVFAGVVEPVATPEDSRSVSRPASNLYF
jgi:hypothetical protein